jgi:hypothetical protein
MKQQDTGETADRASTQPRPRKSYQKPELQVYGDLTEISQSVMGMMANDGAGHPNRHFTS